MTIPFHDAADPIGRRRRLRFISSIACISLGSGLIGGTAIASGQPLVLLGFVMLVAGQAVNTRLQVELARNEPRTS